MIRYQELAFPEVEALDRGMPVRIGGDRGLVLPPAPFASLDLPARGPLLESVLACLREDGFADVGVIDEPEVLPWPPDAGARVALVPIGHVEQHGLHLPLSTDTVIAEAMAAEVEARVPDLVHRLPAWPYGVSMHRRQFPGTLSCDPRLFEDLWVQLVGALRGRGFEAVYFLNGHGGNHSFLVNAVKFAGDRWPDVFAATSFLHTSSGRAADLLHETRESPRMGHACELETSYMLHLRPDLVRMERAVDEADFVATRNYSMDWCSEGALIANPPWTDDTRTGAYGSPRCATAGKGRLWLAAAADEIALHVQEVREQQERRRQRRREGWVEGAWRG